MIHVAKPSLSSLEERYLLDAFRSGKISASGEYIDRFEEAFREYHGLKHAISCSNGTSALHLALLALGVKRGDEVIIPNMAFVAVRNAVLYQRAVPVCAEVDESTWNIDPARVEKLISSRTKAIIAVHTYGNPCDMRSLMKLASDKGINLIEDCAESFGSKFEEQLCGTMSTVAVFSFYGNKTISTGQGGMIITDSDDIAAICSHYKNHAIAEPYNYTDVGYNYRMTNIEAALGLAQMKRARDLLKMKKGITYAYEEFPYEKQGVHPSSAPIFWMNAIKVPDVPHFRNFMTAREIETRPAFSPFNPSLPVSQKLLSQIVCLPSGPSMAIEKIRKVKEAVHDYYNQNRRDHENTTRIA